MRRLMAAASLFALMAGAAAAQTPQELRVGQRVSGALTDSDATADDYRYDGYRISARAGQRLEAVLRSDAFDAYLSVYREGEMDAPLAEDDDGLGEETHARLRFTPEQDGVYVLRARTLGGLDGGDYTLSLTERPPAPRPPRPRGVRVGDQVSGDISTRDPEGDNDVRYDPYSVRARAGERIAMTLTAAEGADELDLILKVGRMRGDVFTQLTENDDHDGLNPYLVFTAPEAGEYVIRAGALTGEGRYSLKLEEGPPPLPASDIAIGGEAVSGRIDSSDGRDDGGFHADAYRFSGRAGQRIRASLSSEDFDSYLTLRRESGGAPLAENDDGGGEGTNSLIVHTLPEDGVYVLEARPLNAEDTGAYELRLEETAPEREPAPLAFGVKIAEASVTDEDPKDEEERGFDSYVIEGEAGQRLQAIMRSGDFDTYLRIGKAGDSFEELAADDDGLGRGTDSRLNFTVPETGRYVLRASPLTADEDGLYSLELIDRGPEPSPGSILVGATARGVLTEADASGENGSFFDAYRLEAKRGETLRMTLVSNAFDAVIRVGREKDGGFEELETDDDGLSDTHARLDWEAPSDGTYLIQAGSFEPSGTGEYALTVERKP